MSYLLDDRFVHWLDVDSLALCIALAIDFPLIDGYKPIGIAIWTVVEAKTELLIS